MATSVNVSLHLRKEDIVAQFHEVSTASWLTITTKDDSAYVVIFLSRAQFTKMLADLEEFLCKHEYVPWCGACGKPMDTTGGPPSCHGCGETYYGGRQCHICGEDEPAPPISVRV